MTTSTRVRDGLFWRQIGNCYVPMTDVQYGRFEQYRDVAESERLAAYIAAINATVPE